MRWGHDWIMSTRSSDIVLDCILHIAYCMCEYGFTVWYVLGYGGRYEVGIHKGQLKEATYQPTDKVLGCVFG